MINIDFDETDAKWFEMEGGGRVRLKLPTRPEWKEIRRQTVQKKVEFKKVDGTPGRFESEKIDQDLQDELFLDIAIVNFEGFSSKGNPIPCTKENKILLMTNRKFAIFFEKCFQLLTEDEAKQTEASQKN